MAADSWPYVIAAYGATWVVLLGYSIRLIRMVRQGRTAASPSAPRS